MSNIDKYNDIFLSRLRVTKDQLDIVRYQSISTWDSVGHMILIAAIEDEFNIMMDTGDIVNFSSYEDGKDILRKYGVSI